jgi:photosystem II stability/assembly factor-like uncharacterized protein
MYKTTNGGVNWISINSGTIQNIHSLWFLNSEVGWYGSTLSTIRKTTDGGINWVSQNTNINQDPITGIHFTDSLNGYAISNTRIFKTNNGGQSWTSQTNSQYWNNAIAFFGPQNGITVGPGTSIKRTSDGGTSWQITAGTDVHGPFNRIMFSDSLHGWMVGLNSLVVKTQDGGITWQQMLLNTSVSGLELLDACFLTPNVGYIVGKNGTVMKTINGGASFTYFNLFASNLDVYGVFFLNVDTGWVCGRNSMIFKTVNGGITWTAQNLPVYNYGCKAIFFANANVGYVGCYNNIIYKTIDGGNTWVMQNTSGSGGDIVRIQFVNADTGWSSTSSGYFWRTTDGGNTWTTSNQNGFSSTSGFHFLDALNGFAVGGGLNWDQSMDRTYDGGLSWHNTHIPVGVGLISCWMLDTNSVFACGYVSTLIHYGDSLVSPPILVSNLNLQESTPTIYPNPCKDVLNIASESYDTEIRVYDLLGKCLFQTKNVRQVNVSNFANGIYILELRNKFQLERKRFMVDKQ